MLHDAFGQHRGAKEEPFVGKVAKRGAHEPGQVFVSFHHDVQHLGYRVSAGARANHRNANVLVHAPFKRESQPKHRRHEAVRRFEVSRGDDGPVLANQRVVLGHVDPANVGVHSKERFVQLVANDSRGLRPPGGRHHHDVDELAGLLAVLLLVERVAELLGKIAHGQGLHLPGHTNCDGRPRRDRVAVNDLGPRILVLHRALGVLDHLATDGGGA